MTTYPGLPVAGYQPQSDAKIAAVNEFKAIEERALRLMDKLVSDHHGTGFYDPRWLAIGKTELQRAFMSINRSVFQPSRVRLAEDPAP